MNRLRAAAGLLLSCLLAACSGDGDNGYQPNVVTHVTAVRDSVQIFYGKSDTLRANARNSRDEVVADAPIIWTSTNPLVFVIDNGNVVRPTSLGTAFAVASVGGFADSTRVVVMADSAQSTDISVTIRGPAENGFIGDSLNLNLRITTKFSLSALRVMVGPTTIPLDLSKLVLVGGGGTYNWNQVISLGGVPSGVFPLSVTATDVNGSTRTSSIQVSHDIPPKISILSPLNDYDVFTGSVPLRISCVDAEKSGCTELTVDFSGISTTGSILNRRVAATTSLIDVSVPVTDWGVTSLSVQITAKDSSTQGTIVQRKILVANNAALQRLTTVPGFVVDADASRVLYTTSGNTGELHIRNGASDDATIISATRLRVPQGYLMPFGAVFTYNDSNAPISDLLREYRNGSLLTLNGVTRQLIANGPYAAWTYPSNSPSPLTFRDFVAGTQRTVVIGTVQSFHVSTNGHTVYSLISGVATLDNAHQIMLDSTDIAHDLNAANLYPKTDGTRVIFTKLTTATTGANTYTVLYSPTRLDTLAVFRSSPPTGNYDINDGWVAYQKPDATGTMQVWTRSPAGEQKQVSVFAAHSFVELVTPDGTVVFNNQSIRYVARPPYSSLNALGDGTPKVVIRNGVLLLLFGGSVFRVN